jgi:ABC-type multidrug transport system fused ATPase/permease subunit
MWEQVKLALDQSTARFLTRLAGLLPGIVALILALVVSIFLAWIIAMVVRRLLTGMQFDERLVRWGFPSVAEWSPMKSPTRLVSRAIVWLVILVGFLIGVAAFNADLTSLMVRNVFAYLPNLIGAFIVLLVGGLIARFLGRSVLIGAVNMNFQYARLLSLGVKWLVIVLTVAMALEHLRIAQGIVELAFGILFGGIVLALALAVGLGSKELVTKSLDPDAKKSPAESVEEPFRHL